MSEKLDGVLQSMRELTTAVRDHRADPATLDFESVKGLFAEQIEAMVALQLQAKVDAMPVYRIPGEAIAAGQMVDAGLLSGNRYARALRDFGRQGYHSSGTVKVKPIDLWLAERLLRKGHALMPDRVTLPSDDLKAALKALTSTGSGTGDELVPTNMAAELWQDFFLASRVAGLFDTIEMPTNPFDVPLGLGDVTWRKGTENTATTASDPATAKSTLTATELVAEINWSYTLQEDAIIALMPAIRSRLAISGGEVVDAFALNADATNAGTGNINLDDADPVDTVYYLSDGQDGIRHQWLVDCAAQGVNAGGDALSDTDVLGALALMGKYAVNPEQTAMLCDVTTYLKGFLDLDAVITVDKFGPQAVVLTGQLAAYRGVPLVVSASAPLTEADGKVSTTADNNTLGQVSIVNRQMWIMGFMRDLLIEVDRDIQKRQYIMVVSLREAIAAHGTRASATHTAGIYNILV